MDDTDSNTRLMSSTCQMYKWPDNTIHSVTHSTGTRIRDESFQGYESSDGGYRVYLIVQPGNLSNIITRTQHHHTCSYIGTYNSGFF